MGIEADSGPPFSLRGDRLSAARSPGYLRVHEDVMKTPYVALTYPSQSRHKPLT